MGGREIIAYADGVCLPPAGVNCAQPTSWTRSSCRAPRCIVTSGEINDAFENRGSLIHAHHPDLGETNLCEITPWENATHSRSASRSFSHNVPHRERLARATSQLGRKRRVQAANTALSSTTSRLGRNRPEQDPASGERQNSPSQLPGQRWGTSLLEKAFLSQAGTLCQTRPAFAPQICDLLPRRDLAQPRLVQSGDKSSVVLDGTRSKPWLSACPKH